MAQAADPVQDDACNFDFPAMIAEATRDWLAHGLPEDLAPEAQTHAHDGPLPAVRRCTCPEARGT